MSGYAIELDHDTEVPIIVEALRVYCEKLEAVLVRAAAGEQVGTSVQRLTEILEQARALLGRLPPPGLDLQRSDGAASSAKDAYGQEGKVANDGDLTLDNGHASSMSASSVPSGAPCTSCRAGR